MLLRISSFIFIFGFPAVVIGALTCEDCPKCEGTCQKTPNNFMCQCPANTTGDNCNICLIRSEWTDGGNGYQYSKTATKSNYLDSEKQCENFGGHLAIYAMRDPVVYDRIAMTDVFVGLTDRFTEGDFFWNDVINASHTFTKWEAGEPSGSTDDHDCGFLKNSSGDILMFDHPCSAIEYGLCEVPIGHPPGIPKFDPKNGCEYFLIPPATRQVSGSLCREKNGNLAVTAVNTGKVLKKILHHFKVNKDLTTPDANIYIGFRKNGSTFTSYDGIPLNATSTAYAWKSGSPEDPAKDCLTTSLTPDWLENSWIVDNNCDEILYGLCEVCDATPTFDQTKCKSGKNCSDNSICVIHEGSCFEGCYCSPGNLINETETCPAVTCHGYDCGANAVCVFDKVEQKPSCKCDKNYLPNGVDGDGCYPIDCDPPCENADCVINQESNILLPARCECRINYMPHPTDTHRCIEDRCASGNITCTASTCCVTNQTSLEQGCICDEGFYKSANDDTLCIDPCAVVTCGDFSFCALFFDTVPPTGKCVCEANYLPEPSPSINCFRDQCGTGGTITCGNNSVCCLTDEATNAQGCVCLSGFHKNPTDPNSCIDLCAEAACTNNTHCIITSETGTPAARCVCDANYMPSISSNGSCIEDLCATTITCLSNSVCTLTNPLTQAQGCVCEDGFFPIGNDSTNCTDCPVISYSFNAAKSTANYLLVDVDMPELNDFTVCVKYTRSPGETSDLGALISYATKDLNNAFLIDFISDAQHYVYFLHDDGDSVINVRQTIDFMLSDAAVDLCWVISKSIQKLLFYVDGTFNADKDYTDTNTLPQGFGTLVIGQAQASFGGGFNSLKALRGRIENLRMYTRALTPTEITNMTPCDCKQPFLQLTDDVVTVIGNVTQTFSTEC